MSNNRIILAIDYILQDYRQILIHLFQKRKKQKGKTKWIHPSPIQSTRRTKRYNKQTPSMSLSTTHSKKMILEANLVAKTRFLYTSYTGALHGQMKMQTSSGFHHEKDMQLFQVNLMRHSGLTIHPNILQSVLKPKFTRYGWAFPLACEWRQASSLSLECRVQ